MESKYKKILLGLGVAIALVIGVGATVPEQQPTPLASSSPTTWPTVGNVGDGQGPGNGNMPGGSSEPSNCIEAVEASALVDQAQVEVQAGYAAAQNIQLSLAASHVEKAGRMYIDASQYVHDTPEISVPLTRAGQLLVESSVQLKVGNISKATDLLAEAIPQIESITSATEAYGVAC